jgi:hypothetical protein
MKSATMVSTPMHMPPNDAATGMYFASRSFMFFSWLRCPTIIICCSFSCFATSFADVPDTSIHVRENTAQILSSQGGGGGCT